MKSLDQVEDLVHLIRHGVQLKPGRIETIAAVAYLTSLTRRTKK
jgi:hypothetical protein